MDTPLNTQNDSGETENISKKKKYKFSELLSDPVIHERWNKIRKYFFLRESTYDMTNTCNIRCDGCYYFEGDKQFVTDNRNPDDWKSLIRKEKDRGITFVVLAGAEPSLVPELLNVCYDIIPLGCIASNGLKHIPESVQYKIHISVWGNDDTSIRIRNVRNLLEKQIDNYSNDPRTVFVYTFTRNNIAEARRVTEKLSAHNCKITFNVFSSPIGYSGPLRHSKDSLDKTRQTMLELLSEFPDTVLFSPYSAMAHTHPLGLHDLYTCSYPRMNPSTEIGLGRSFRQYRSDLSIDRSAACCVPDTDCTDCRHYASGSAIITARLYRHAADLNTFKGWLDYVDTYLSVWVMGYEKDTFLCTTPVAPTMK